MISAEAARCTFAAVAGNKIGGSGAADCGDAPAGTGGSTSTLISAVLTGSALADGTACDVTASFSNAVRRADEISMPFPQ